MAGHLLVMNPRRRRRRRFVRNMRRRRMTAKQLRYFGRNRRRRRGAGARHHSRKRRTILIATKNPRRRHRRRRFAHNPIRRRFRRNPIRHASFNSFISDALVPAAIGAVGAIGTDMVLAQVANYLPTTLTQGPLVPVVRIGAAFLMGIVIGDLVDERTGELVAAGAMTVALYGTAKQWLQTAAPSLPLARYVPMNRYMGFVRQRRRLSAAPRRMFRRRAYSPALRGVPTNSGTRMRLMRGQQLGYIGPAPTLARYMNHHR